MGNAGFDRKSQRLGIHMSHHQQHAVTGIGDDGCDQPVGVEAGREGLALLLRLLV